MRAESWEGNCRIKIECSEKGPTDEVTFQETLEVEEGTLQIRKIYVRCSYRGWTINSLNSERTETFLMHAPACSFQNCSQHLAGVDAWVELKTSSMLCLSQSGHISHFQMTFLRGNITNRQLSERWQTSTIIKTTHTMLSKFVKYRGKRWLSLVFI
jgi:hypothetical protein